VSDAAFQQVVKYHDVKLETGKLAELIKERPEPRVKPDQ
jgi:hypothetical protein